MAPASFQAAPGDFRDPPQSAGCIQVDAFEVLENHCRENVDEISKFLQRG